VGARLSATAPPAARASLSCGARVTTRVSYARRMPRTSGPKEPLAPLDRVVKERLSLTWNAAREAIRTGKVFVGEPGAPVTDPRSHVRLSEKIELVASAPRPHVAHRAELERSAIVHVDNAVVVVNKPAGVTTVPFGDESPEQARHTLDALVREILARRFPGGRGRSPLGVVQRLDKVTSGLLAFRPHALGEEAPHAAAPPAHDRTAATSRSPTATCAHATYRTHIVSDRGDGLRGSADPPRTPGEEELAITHVERIEAPARRDAHLVPPRDGPHPPDPHPPRGGGPPARRRARLHSGLRWSEARRAQDHAPCSGAHLRAPRLGGGAELRRRAAGGLSAGDAAARLSPGRVSHAPTRASASRLRASWQLPRNFTYSERWTRSTR
jgi:23S rRNA-/tRNA-specific pseudouridylate synthase